MKKILLLATLIATSFSLSAQYELTGKMYNTSNVYRNVLTPSTFATSRILDTAATGATTYLYISSLSTGHVNADTILPYNLAGYGSISFLTSAYLASITTSTATTVLVTPETSFNGIDWATVTAASTYTLTCSSRTVSATQNILITYKPGYYNRLKCVTSGDTASIGSYWYLQKPVSYLLNIR